jgi:protein involved in polysaccharide export with SLBB domain
VSPSPLPTGTPVQPDSVLNSVNPATYRLGPGDVLSVHVIGPPNAPPVQAPLAPDGTLVVYPAGKVRLGGLTVTQAQRRLGRVLSAYYRNFEVTLTLIGVRHFIVGVVGEVAAPGRVEVDGLTNVYQAVLKAGGLTEKASQRRIELRDAANRLRARVDLLRWRLFGQPAHVPALRPNDSIVVPALGPVVAIGGAVRIPGQYEILDSDSVDDLIRLAGGLTAQADGGRVQVHRLTPDGERKLYVVDASAQSVPPFMLRNGDRIDVTDRTIGRGVVYVSGEFAAQDKFTPATPVANAPLAGPRRAMLPLSQGQTLKDLVLALGGPTVKADLRHGFLIRRENGVDVRERIDFWALLHGEGTQPDLALESGDTVVLPALPDLVYVVGEVLRSGPFPYNPEMGVRQYLTLAGGTTMRASTRHGRIIRVRDGEKPQVFKVDYGEVMKGKKEAPVIEPGDIVYVPRSYPLIDDITRIISSVFWVRSIFP